MRLLAFILPLCLLTLSCASKASESHDGEWRVIDRTASERPPSHDALFLKPTRKVGERIRTKRHLAVREDFGSGQSRSVEHEEAFISEILRVDDEGAAMQLRRRYEQSLTRVKNTGDPLQEVQGALQGCELELTQLVDGVSTRLVSGNASREDYSNLLIASSDLALLPKGEARLGNRWELNANNVSQIGGFFNAFGVDAAKNVVTLEYYDLRDGAAHLAINWRITGKIGDSAPMVFRFSGELVFNIDSQIITELSLAGGKVDDKGRVGRDISIHITRKVL